MRKFQVFAFLRISGHPDISMKFILFKIHHFSKYSYFQTNLTSGANRFHFREKSWWNSRARSQWDSKTSISFIEIGFFVDSCNSWIRGKYVLVVQLLGVAQHKINDFFSAIIVRNVKCTNLTKKEFHDYGNLVLTFKLPKRKAFVEINIYNCK